MSYQMRLIKLMRLLVIHSNGNQQQTITFNHMDGLGNLTLV